MSRPVMRIEGLRELTRSLKAAEDGLQKEVNAIFKGAATKVASAARRRLPKRSGRLAASVRPFGTQRKPGVRVGRARAPYAGPVEFGGYPKGRPFVPEGRYIYPTFSEMAPQVRKDLAEELNALIRRAGLD